MSFESFGDLAKGMRKLNRKIPKFASDKASELGLRINTGLIGSTPVDTSKALSNWQIGVGTPPTDEIEAYFPGEGGSSQVASARAAYFKARNDLKAKKPGVAIYIVNNTDYIDKLNAGSSPQAPAGFVEFQIEFHTRGFNSTEWQLEL